MSEERWSKREFAERFSLSAAQVRKLADKGRFELIGEPGWFEARKSGPSRTSPVMIERLPEHTRKAASALELNELKAQKMAAEIENLKMRTIERQALIERNYELEIIERITEALEPLKRAFTKCKLTPEQAEIITAALCESQERLEKYSTN